MRLILTILLIGLLKADAQMVINASSPYRPLAANLLLDDYANAQAAYSLRKLRTAYTGNCIRVRRDSTGQTESDIGFTQSGILDTVALKNFIRNNNGFIVTWYDQTSNAYNITQTTQANQPRIINAGVLQLINNKPTLFFNGTTHRLAFASLTPTNYLHQSGNGAIFSVQSIASQSNVSLSSSYRLGTPETGYIINHNTNGSILFRVNNAGTAVVSNTTANTLTTNNTNFLLSILTHNGNATAANRSYLYFNNTLYQNNASTGTPSTGTSSRIARLGSTAFDNFFWTGTISEFILYNSDQTTNRSGIQSNINSFYGIY